MKRRGADLAARLRERLDATQQTTASADAEHRARVAQGEVARAALLDDLEAFGRALGHLDVQRLVDGVTLRWGERVLTFTAAGEGDRVRVSYPAAEARGEAQRLYREPHLGDRWVWVRSRGRREDRLPVFDAGLELLLIDALGLPEEEAELEPMPPPSLGSPAPSTDAPAPASAPETPDAMPPTFRRRNL